MSPVSIMGNCCVQKYVIGDKVHNTLPETI